jgi:hypothetical protein
MIFIEKPIQSFEEMAQEAIDNGNTELNNFLRNESNFYNSFISRVPVTVWESISNKIKERIASVTKFTTLERTINFELDLAELEFLRLNQFGIMVDSSYTKVINDNLKVFIEILKLLLGEEIWVNHAFIKLASVTLLKLTIRF